jgi:hypothetical protein
MPKIAYNDLVVSASNQRIHWQLISGLSNEKFNQRNPKNLLAARG